jgi:phosphatidylinositol alpha-1,6-mannosyltransferase
MYHIVGLPTEKEKIVKLAKELEVTNHIKLYGKVTERKKWKLLLSSSIFIMLSEVTNEGGVEGFGIAILEANSIGIPSIGSKNCGIEDAIDNGKSGVLVNGQNSEMILKAVNDICDTYEVYSKNAKNWSKSFSWDKIVKQYIEVIDK